MTLGQSVIDAMAEMAEADKKSIPNMNDFLGKLLTLDTALIGGGMVLAKGEVMPMWVSTIVVTAFCSSAAFCLFGLKPYKVPLGNTVESIDPYYAAQERAMHLKERAMKRAMLAFGIAMVIGLGGMLVKALDPTPAATPTTQAQK